MKEESKVKGKFTYELFNSQGELKDKGEFSNAAVEVGRNYLLNAGFHGSSPVTTWYIGLIDNGSFSALADGDTMALHSGWIEDEDYSETTRGTWTEGAASASVMTNGTSVDFTIDTDGSLQGAFVTSDNTKGGTSGTLWATGLFTGAPISVTNGDVLKITYTITLYT